MCVHIAISLLTLLLLVFSPSSIAIDSASGEPGSAWVRQIDYVEDAHGILDTPTALKLLKHYRTRSLSDSVFNLGLVESRYWLRMSLTNPGADSISLRLLASVAYRRLLTASLHRDSGESRIILEDSVSHRYDERPVDFRYLSSKPFMLEAGESADILIEYHTLGSSYLPLSVVTEDAFDSLRVKDSVHGAFFYSFSLAAIVVFMLFSLAMMDKVSALYGLLFMLGLLFIASMEGYAFKYLWPDWPAWNNLSPLVLQYALSAFGLLVSYQVLSTDNKLRRYLRSVIGLVALVCLILMLLSSVLPFVPMANIASLFIALMFVSQGYALSTWMSFGQKRNAVAILAGVLLAVFVSVMVLLSFDVSILPAYFYIYSTRLVYLLASLATMATIIAHVSGLRQDHEKSLQNELLLMKREAETNRALYEAEQNYSRARELAHYRQQQLASASHDMRQPLFSLRSTIDAIVHNEPTAIKNQLRNAFDYLENLCSQYLRDTRPGQDIETSANKIDTERPETDSAAEPAEPYSLCLLLETAGRMFREEAEHKGLQFRLRSSSVMVAEPPLLLMRIITNLLSNAVKHTGQGSILLGARRRAGRVCIQVIDTGAGMDPHQLDRLSRAYEKGPESSGEGLGLAICRQLARQQGMQLDIVSTPGKGTCCSLCLSRVNSFT